MRGFTLSRCVVPVIAAALPSMGIWARADVAGAGAAPAPAVAPNAGNWWDPQPQPATPVPPVNVTEPVRPPFRQPNSGFNITDYPTAQMNDWVMASAMAARARMMLARAEGELSATLRRMQMQFEHSREYSDVLLAQKQAYADYTAARQRAMTELCGDPRYHAISLLRDELGEKIVARRAAKDATKDELVAMATLKMQYASDARAIEVNFLSGDANLKAARDKMVDTSRRLSDLKAQFDYAVREQPDVVIARRNLEDARVGVVEAAALSNSAAIASSYALNYSYFLHRNDNGGTFGPYGPNGVYGVGYNSPYWGH